MVDRVSVAGAAGVYKCHYCGGNFMPVGGGDFQCDGCTAYSYPGYISLGSDKETQDAFASRNQGFLEKWPPEKMQPHIDVINRAFDRALETEEGIAYLSHRPDLKREREINGRSSRK